jgi:hypothetical protein
MTDTLVERLRELHYGTLFNPDGPEAASRIAELEGALDEIISKTDEDCTLRIARKALEGSRKEAEG